VTDYPVQAITDAASVVLTELRKLPWMRAVDSEHLRSTAFDVARAVIESAEPAPDLATLQAMIADLDGYITRRAEEIARPIITEAQERARGDVASALHDTQRARDVSAELGRRLNPLQRQADEAAAARDDLARALGYHPVGHFLPALVAEAIQRLRPEGKPDA
jgi:hypothetical protein